VQHTYPTANRNPQSNSATDAKSNGHRDTNAKSYGHTCAGSGVEYLDAAAR